jgi:hypothetical protein
MDRVATLHALQQQLRTSPKDFRTRLLIRDTMQALEARWGSGELLARLDADVLDEAKQIRAEDLGRPGFPLLEQRMTDATDPTTILQFFRELGREVHSPVALNVGGSTALILRGLLMRGTDDIDAVDEVPAVIRTQYELLGRLASRYRLQLNHFQSHYLPSGWESRVESCGVFEKLSVFLVDPIDIAVRKLFSKREKDLDDLRVLAAAIDRKVIERRLTSCAGFLNDPALRALAEKSWYILYGNALPT